MDLRDVPNSMSIPRSLKTPELPEDLELAGRAFRDAIVNLGLSVEGLLWVNVTETQKFEMWIIWSGLDTYGPLAIAKVLFRAYNAAVLHQAIDPFDINVVGPQHIVARLHGAFNGNSDIKAPGPAEYTALYLKQDEVKKSLVAIKRSWILLPVERRLPKKEIDRGWHRFQANVARLAA